MRQLITILMVLVVGMFLTTTATADDEDDVKAAVQALYETLNKGDADGRMKLNLPETSGFARTGGLFNLDARTVEDRRNDLQARFDAGLKWEQQVHHLNAKVYGNAAITTYYTAGSTTYPNGDVLQGTFRCTIVWIKQAGQWKVAHTHISRLQTEPQ